MTSERYKLLMEEMDALVAKVLPYPEHLQNTALRQLCKALVSPSGAPGAESASEMSSNADATSESGTEDWDYRRELLQHAEKHELNLKSMSHHHYATLVAYVLENLCPDGHQAPTLNADLVPDAWRAAGRKRPYRDRDPLNRAAGDGLLEKDKASGSFRTTPPGENYILDLLAGGNSN